MKLRMKKTMSVMVLGCSLMSMVGCSNLSNQDIGTVTGGVAGGLLGSTIGSGGGKMLAIGMGTLAGAYIGGKIGHNMDETDQLKAQRAFEQAPTGHQTTWQNPDSGNRYTVTPERTFQNQAQQPCREYNMTAIIGGKKEHMYGTACRQADGSWKTQN